MLIYNWKQKTFHVNKAVTLTTQFRIFPTWLGAVVLLTMQHKAEGIMALPLEHNPWYNPSQEGESLGNRVPLSLNLLHGLGNLYPSPAQAKFSVKQQHIRISEEIWGKCKEQGSSQLEDKDSARPCLQPFCIVVHCGLHLVLSAHISLLTNAPHSVLPLLEGSLAWNGLFLPTTTLPTPKAWLGLPHLHKVSTPSSEHVVPKVYNIHWLHDISCVVI